MTALHRHEAITRSQDNGIDRLSQDYRTATTFVDHQIDWRPTDQRTTDKASRSMVDARTTEHGTQGSTNRGIGPTESRLATLRGQLDFNEMDHSAPSNVDLFGQRSAPLSASANGESSAGLHIYASPGGPEV